MNQLALVFGVTMLAVISPGADFAMVSRNSYLYGRQAGTLSALGIAASCWTHVFYAVFLLSSMQVILTDLLLYVRYAGAAYLLYVGIRTILSGSAIEEADERVSLMTPSRSFLDGFLTNALNPKTAVFVISLYTQVIGPDSPVSYALMCGMMISLCHLAWFVAVSYVLSQDATRRWILARAGMFNRVIGVFLVCIGLALGLFDHGGAHP
ncbi:MAG: LysE family translocator [Acetobacter sp.]|jgi:threonine/homoserine/homoserine lactone efflux protein